jgi:hypothetical protein
MAAWIVHMVTDGNMIFQLKDVTDRCASLWGGWAEFGLAFLGKPYGWRDPWGQAICMVFSLDLAILGQFQDGKATYFKDLEGKT